MTIYIGKKKRVNKEAVGKRKGKDQERLETRLGPRRSK